MALKYFKLLRIALYLYVLLVICPIRYWPLESGVDQTWRFALNYAHAERIETIFTNGPLAYLIFPQHVGNNLPQGLLFQAGLWLVLAAILGDVFFRGDFRLRNLAVFSLCLCLAAPLFWFNYFGVENLMLAGALLLLLMFHFHGSWTRYLGALVLVGLLPLFKPTAGVAGFGALAGFLVEQAVRQGRKAIAIAALAALVPAVVAISIYLLLLSSVTAVVNYWRGTLEVMGGFTAAMSLAGDRLELISAAEATGVLIIVLWLHARSKPGVARFYALLFAIPLFVGFKHGFVRQDVHVVNFFCFVALALALLVLTLELQGRNTGWVLSLVILFGVFWQDDVIRRSGWSVLSQATGRQAAGMLWGAVRFGGLEQRLDSAVTAFPETSRLEPEIVNAIGDSSVASLSLDYTNLAAARTHFKLYPVIQRYQAYTPYLDGLNAAWIRDKGPRFLVFDGRTIEDIDPWADTPATWLEVYRWYDTRMLGSRNLLLERRAEPRFTSLESMGRFPVSLPGGVRLPVSRGDICWRLHCGYSTKGTLRKLLFRIPGVFVSIREASGVTRTARIIPDVLFSPLPGNYWPGNLAQFAAVFQAGGERGDPVSEILFWGGGSSSYASCEAEVLRLVR